MNGFYSHRCPKNRPNANFSLTQYRKYFIEHSQERTQTQKPYVRWVCVEHSALKNCRIKMDFHRWFRMVLIQPQYFVSSWENVFAFICNFCYFLCVNRCLNSHFWISEKLHRTFWPHAAWNGSQTHINVTGEKSCPFSFRQSNGKDMRQK